MWKCKSDVEATQGDSSLPLSLSEDRLLLAISAQGSTWGGGGVLSQDQHARPDFVQHILKRHLLLMSSGAMSVFFVWHFWTLRDNFLSSLCQQFYCYKKKNIYWQWKIQLLDKTVLPEARYCIVFTLCMTLSMSFWISLCRVAALLMHSCSFSADSDVPPEIQGKIVIFKALHSTWYQMYMLALWPQTVEAVVQFLFFFSVCSCIVGLWVICF